MNTFSRVTISALLGFTLFQATALAQTEANLPPRASSTSPTGVNFNSGSFNAVFADLSIGGEGGAGLSLIRSYSSTNTTALAAGTGANGWTFNIYGAIFNNTYVYPPDEEPPPNGPPQIYTVTTGTKTSKFRNGTLPLTKDGTSLATGTVYTFTESDGKVSIFDLTTKLIQSATYPDGTRLDYSYSPKRMIISNRGYAMLWESASKVCVINMAEYYVSSASTTCPAGAQTMTYGYTAGKMTSSTNPAGFTTSYEYVGASHLGCIKEPGQTTCKISNVYSVCGAPSGGGSANRLLDPVASQTTATGESYSYAFSKGGALPDFCNDYGGYGVSATMTSPGSNVTKVSTNGAGAVTRITDPLNRSTSINLVDGTGNDDSAILFKSQTEAEGNGQYVIRDSRGNITERWIKAKSGTGLADVKLFTASFPASCANRKTCNKPDYTIDAKGNRTDYTYDPNHGGVLTVTSPAADANAVRPARRFGYTQLYAWIKNVSGSYVQAATPVWVLTSISQCRLFDSCAGSPDEIKTTIGYGAVGTPNNLLPTVVSTGSGDGSLVSTISTSYDYAGNATAIDGPLPGPADTTRYRYDSMRRLIGVVSPDPDGAGPLKNRAIKYSFDSSGNLVKMERGTVNSQSDTDWLAFAAAESTDSVYDLMGRVLKVSTSGSGTTFSVTQYSYDGSGRLLCTANRMDPAQWTSQPDACVPQTSGQFGPDRITRNVYTAAGEVRKLQTGVGLGAAVETDEQTISYTSNGRVLSVADGNGSATTTGYDGYDRAYKTTYVDGSYEQLAYDWNGNTESRRLRDGQTIGFTYDNLNRLIFKDLPGTETDISYSMYDLQGNPLQVIGDVVFWFSYDALGRRLSESGPNETMSYQVDLAGRRVLTHWPDGGYTTQDYLLTGELSEVRQNSSTQGVNVVANYDYDDLGRRTKLTRGNGSTTSYGYDQISRLASLSHDLGGTLKDVSWSYSYNPAGQISSSVRSNDSYAWNGHANSTRSETTNDLNQITSFGSSAISYDARGNLITRGGSTFSYTSENLLKSGPSGATLKYDPLGRLYETSKAGVITRFQYDGTRLVAEYSRVGNVSSLTNRYVFGDGADEPVVGFVGTGFGTPRYFHQDERGSVIAVTDGGGASIATNTYDEFGVPGSANIGRFSFTGQTWLPEINQHYFKARIYSPTLGRFMQTDPIGYVAGANIYGYVGGDPVNSVDPRGLEGERNYFYFGNPTNAWANIAGVLRNYGEKEERKPQQVASVSSLSDAQIVCQSNGYMFCMNVSRPLADSMARTQGALAVAGAAFFTVEYSGAYAVEAIVARVAYGGLSQGARYGLGTYNALRKAVGNGSGLEVHHLLNERFAALLGQNAGQMLSVVVTKAEHAVFTAAWRQAIPYGAGTANATVAQVTAAARQIYANYPAILAGLGL